MNRTFASDNYSSVHPEVMRKLQEVNVGHEISYGDDQYTAQATEVFLKVFGENIEVVFLAGGTAANIYSLKLLLEKPYDAAIVAATSHMFNDETGAAQSVLGAQLFPIQTPDGKLTVELLNKETERRAPDNPHSALPKVVSITQLAEYGTLYTPDEVRSIADWCHERGMYLHMDGNRLANAAVALDLGLREASGDLGVDVLSFGGAKNGLMNAEAVVVFNAPKSDLIRMQKQVMHLTSKMRYVSAQFIPYLEHELWRTNARNANELAKRLAEGLDAAALESTQKVEGNQIFVVMSEDLKEGLHQAGHHFYDWDTSKNEVRLVTAWDNTEEDVERFLTDINRLAR